MNLFISRNLGPQSYIANIAKEHGWNLTDLALIQQIPILPAEPLPDSDYLFFTSPTAATIFIRAYGIPDRPVCTLGKGTSKALPTEIQPLFEGVGNAQKVAEDFALFAQNKIVLFPIGNQSVRTIQQALRPEKCREYVLYKTLPKHIELPPQDIYVFTSPSNVKSFLDVNPPLVNANVISLGQKTADELNKNSISSILSEDYTPEGIVNTIFSIVGS